jgi:protein-disulfide isomerase
LGAAWLGEPTGQTSTVAPAAALSGVEREEFVRWWSAQPRVELPIEADGAAVLVVKFNDYMCPPCRQTYLNYRPVFAKYEAERPGAVKLVMKHYPLDPECNSTAPNGVHYASCEAAAAVLLAGRGGADVEALEVWFFDRQATLSPSSVQTAARDVGGVEDFEAEYPAMLDQIREDIALGVSLGVEATPTFVINGVRVTGGLTVPYFDAAIAYELERAAATQ